MKGGWFKGEHQHFKNITNWNGKLDIRYCHERDVNKNNHMFLFFKACFLQKIRSLQLNGNLNILLGRLYRWIDIIADQMFNQLTESVD